MTLLCMRVGEPDSPKPRSETIDIVIYADPHNTTQPTPGCFAEVGTNDRLT